jgi:molybdopterin-guanine dinucleotide biosynthesis protein MobB
MDTEGTNTWRYTQAGSKVVVAISPQEVDVIKKTNRELENLDEIISLLENENLDIIFIEGFHSLIAKRTDIQKIATAKDEADLKRTIEGMAPPVLAASGRIALNTSKTCFGNIPYIAIPQDGQRLVDLIKAELQKQNAKEAAA